MKTLELDPTYQGSLIWLALTYLQSGRVADASALIGKLEEPAASLLRAHALVLSGRRPDAQRMLPDLEELVKKRGTAHSSLALLYFNLGDEERAFAWLDKAYQERDGILPYSKVNPSFDLIRPHPRFQKLLKRMNLE